MRVFLQIIELFTRTGPNKPAFLILIEQRIRQKTYIEIGFTVIYGVRKCVKFKEKISVRHG